VNCKINVKIITNNNFNVRLTNLHYKFNKIVRLLLYLKHDAETHCTNWWYFTGYYCLQVC
jgi:hypothetical protein